MTIRPIIPQKNIALKGHRYETAQIAFLGEQCWKIFGPYWKETGLLEEYPMPELDCPVVDITAVDADQAGKIIRKYTAISECTDVPRLVKALVSIGAKVLR